MEAAHASRQFRLASLSKTRQAAVESQPTVSSSIHPFRQAVSNITARRRTQNSDEEQERDLTDRKAQEIAMSKLAESSREGQLLRKYRNWDPRTGQARDGVWNTVKGIEDEMRNVQMKTLEQDAALRAADLDLSTLAPRRPNWDLRRHLDQRLKKLENRGREARSILIRQRLKAVGTAKASDRTEKEDGTTGQTGRLAAICALTGMSAGAHTGAESDVSDPSSNEGDSDA